MYAKLYLGILMLIGIVSGSLPSKESKLVITNIEKDGEFLVSADLIGIKDECFYGQIVKCSQDGFEISECGTLTNPENSKPYALFKCKDDCECQAEIPPRFVLIMRFETSDCIKTGSYYIRTLDFCFKYPDKPGSYKYTESEGKIIESNYSDNVCRDSLADSDSIYEHGECKDATIFALSDYLKDTETDGGNALMAKGYMFLFILWLII